MGRLASESDFHGGQADALYSDYFEWPEFSARAARYLQRFGQGKCLVVGCGPGYFVKALIAVGIDAYGIDPSQWAVDQAAVIIPNKVMLGDASLQADMNAARAFAGIPGNQRFRAAVSEDCLSVCTDAEAAAIVFQMNRIATSAFHIITCEHPEYPDLNNHVSAINWKTQAEWKAIVGTNACWDDQLQVVF